MHRSTAKTYTKRAQFAGAILVAAAGAVVLVRATPPEPIKLEVPEPVKSTAGADRAARRREIADAAAGLGKNWDNVAPPVAKIERPPTPAGPAAPPPPPPPPPLRYIGAIMTGEFKRAIVVTTDAAMKEQQRMLAVGDVVEKQTVMVISPDSITMRDDKGDEQTIELATRQLRALRIVGPGGAPGAGAGANPNAMQLSPGQNPAMSAEVAALENKVAELQKNGDNESAAKLQGEIDRLRGEKGGKGGRGGKEGGGGGGEGIKGGK